MIDIREALPEDAAALLDYLKKVGAETDNLTFGAEGLPFSAEQEEAYLRSVHEEKHSVCYLARKDGRVVGSGSLDCMPRRMYHRAELGITVIREAWGQGIGSMLMEKLIAYAGENGIELVNLEVRSDNTRAIRLYEKFGFRRIGTSPAYIKIDSRHIDAELMVLDLRQRGGS